MPVIRRGYDDALDVLVLVHLSEIAIAFGLGAAHVLEACLQTRLVDIADADQINVVELLEIGDVLLSDQSESDEPDADAIVGAEHSIVRCGRQGRSTQKPAPGRLGGLDLL